MTGVEGRPLLTRRAVSPLLLTVMMAAAFTSAAVVPAAWAVAPTMLMRESTGALRMRLK